LYSREAGQERDPSQQLVLWDLAAENYANASANASEAPSRERFGNRAAELYNEVARQMVLRGQDREARFRLNKAVLLAAPGSKTFLDAQALRERLTD
jgi:hypothetical protein